MLNQIINNGKNPNDSLSKSGTEVNLINESIADGPLGQFEAIILGERFSDYKNKNQLTIDAFNQK